MRAYHGKRIRNRIYQILLELGISECEFARRHGFQQGHLNRVKNREIEPTGWVMLRIAKALGRPVDEVFQLEDA
jgi:transcriptional regulator with XRE-family HTH domain